MLRYRKFLRFVNRAVYVLSAAMLMAGLVLTVTPRTAMATVVDVCGNIPGNQSTPPAGMQTNGSGNCVCQTGLVQTGSGSGISCVAPTPPPAVCDAAAGLTEDPAHPGTCICSDPTWEMAANGKSCSAPGGNGGGNNGSIWTTEGDCGSDTQDQNHFNIGDVIFINGSGFDIEAYNWEIDGQPGHGSLDPGITVASGSVTPGSDGSFCFEAYTVQNDDGGEYSVKVGNKGDNYRVEPGNVTVCHVPEYTTEEMTVLEWGALQDTDSNDFVVDSTHPCTPPVTYVPVCDVPTQLGGAYSTIQVAEGDLTSWLASHPEDHTIASNSSCGPTNIDVCTVPGYTLTAVDQLFLQDFLTLHPDYFVPTTERPCSEPTVLVCKVPSYQTETMTISVWGQWFLDHQSDYVVTSASQCQPPEQMIWVCHVPDDNPAAASTIQVSLNAWNDADGISHKGHAHDFEVSGQDDPACPPSTVQYCHFDATAYQWSEMSGYSWQISSPDYELASGETCPVKSSYCRYDSQADAYTQVELYPADVTVNDTTLADGAACPAKVTPTAQCVWNNGDGSVDGVFAYSNPNADTVTLPIGADNDLSSTVSSLGGPQPTDFLAGTHTDVFVVSFLDSGTVSWFVKSPLFANGVTATLAADTPACATDPKEETYVLVLDPYCYSVPGDLMQWTVTNPNDFDFTVDSWAIDGVPQASGFMLVPGESLLTTTALGTHTIDLYWGLTGHASLQYTIESCAVPEEPTPSPTVPPTSTPVVLTTAVAPLPIPVTGAGGEIIPVTGADLAPFGNIWMFAGFGLFGLGMVLTGIRRRMGL